MKKISVLLQIVLLISFSIKISSAQSVPVATPALEDAYRRLQLTGHLDSSYSFTIRPVFPISLNKIDNVFDPDGGLEKERWSGFNGIFRSGNDKAMIQLLPISWQQQYNSNNPYGWNDGAMIPSRGYQTILGGGIFARLGPLSIQLRPEYVYAANKEFDGFAGNRPDADLINYYLLYDQIDLPERFGQTLYSKFLWGQSSVRLTFGPVSVGLSNENIWWGPGMRNSLLMSNTAEGFKHLTLNTVKPIRTPIGSFEGQLISGRLEASGYPVLNTQQTSTGVNLSSPKRNDWRYLFGVAISYQPKWLPGLFLGLTRNFQAYQSDLKTIGDYFPLFTPYQKINTDGGDPFDRDQLTSVYARWLFNKAKAEVYVELGKNDNALNLRDLIMSPQHSRAYLVGMRKLVSLRSKSDEYIQFSTEFTQLQQSTDRIIRDASAWYLHNQVRHGYTNRGQVLGAGIGPGGNHQIFGLSWIKGLKQIGFQLERVVYNNDLYYAAFNNSDNTRRQWVDLSAAAHAEWNYKNLIVSTKLQLINSLNYQWRQSGFDPSAYYIPENDLLNFHGQLGLMYRF